MRKTIIYVMLHVIFINIIYILHWHDKLVIEPSLLRFIPSILYIYICIYYIHISVVYFVKISIMYKQFQFKIFLLVHILATVLASTSNTTQNAKAKIEESPEDVTGLYIMYGGIALGFICLCTITYGCVNRFVFNGK